MDKAEEYGKKIWTGGVNERIIIEALRTYAEERVKEVIDGYNDTLAIKKTRDEALEEAASVCDDLECLDEDHQACVSERIRALKSGGK